MKNTLYFLLMFALSCTPKNEEVKDEMVDVGPPAEALDSIASPPKDAVKVDQTEQEVALALPQPVLQLLSQKYPGYEQPLLADAAKKQAAEYEQGPFLVSGNFTNDKYLDYALQLQFEKDVLIIAVTHTSEENWTVHELKRDILFNERGTLKSLYYLYLTEPEELQEVEKEAVSVGLGGKVTTYLYKNNGFESYPGAR